MAFADLSFHQQNVNVRPFNRHCIGCVMLNTLDLSTQTGSGYVPLHGRSTVGTCESLVARTVVRHSSYRTCGFSHLLTRAGDVIVPEVCSSVYSPWMSNQWGLTLLYFLFLLVLLLLSTLCCSEVPSFVPK